MVSRFTTTKISVLVCLLVVSLLLFYSLCVRNFSDLEIQFKNLCHSSARSLAFEQIVSLNTSLDMTHCDEIWHEFQKLKVVTLVDPDHQTGFLKFFPELNMILLKPLTPIQNLDLGHLDKVETVMISGPTALTSLSGLKDLPSLAWLAISGHGNDSFVNLEGVEDLKKLKSLVLYRVHIRSSDRIKNIKSRLSFKSIETTID